jgi:hypothetical protein
MRPEARITEKKIAAFANAMRETITMGDPHSFMDPIRFVSKLSGLGITIPRSFSEFTKPHATAISGHGY